MSALIWSDSTLQEIMPLSQAEYNINKWYNACQLSNGRSLRWFLPVPVIQGHRPHLEAHTLLWLWPVAWWACAVAWLENTHITLLGSVKYDALKQFNRQHAAERHVMKMIMMMNTDRPRSTEQLKSMLSTAVCPALYSFTSKLELQHRREPRPNLGILHRVQKTPPPPKHVKITLWIENDNHYFSLYHKKPSICNVCMKFHNN